MRKTLFSLSFLCEGINTEIPNYLKNVIENATIIEENREDVFQFELDKQYEISFIDIHRVKHSHIFKCVMVDDLFIDLKKIDDSLDINLATLNKGQEERKKFLVPVIDFRDHFKSKMELGFFVAFRCEEFKKDLYFKDIDVGQYFRFMGEEMIKIYPNNSFNAIIVKSKKSKRQGMSVEIYFQDLVEGI